MYKGYLLLSAPLTCTSLLQIMSIIVVNKSANPVQAFVSSYSRSGGDESWFMLEIGDKESWQRSAGGWELVAFRDPNDPNGIRAGVYVKVNSTITFYSFEDICVDNC